MDQNKQDNKMNSGTHYHDGEMCNGMMCWGRHRFSVLRFVLLLLLITFVFSIGVKFGELKGQIDAMYSRGYENQNMQYERGGYMMQNESSLYGNSGMRSGQGMPMQQAMPATGPTASSTL